MSATSGKAKIGAFVFCLKHGKERKGQQYKMVQVPFPKGKNERRFGGCPFCKAESA